ncbi:MAG: phenylacetate--CoA ligase, partial [Verrucomicrobia bacterium]|nr:phenylacetate--CoA ligase [Verrucomicrobiota bacterium]
LRALAAKLGSHNVEVMATYAFTESKTAWPECPTHDNEQSEPSGYHLYPDLGIIEIVNPETGEPMPDGEPGEIVYTPIDSRGSVVIRYRTGDCISGGITYEPCPQCGRKCPRLRGRISRVSDIHRLQIGKIKGTLVNFNDLEHILDDIDGIGVWQIEIRKVNDDPMEPDEIIVHVQAEDAQNEKQLSDKITQQFQSDAEIRPNRVEFHNTETLKEMQGVGVLIKEDKIVDHRPKAPLK